MPRSIQIIILTILIIVSIITSANIVYAPDKIMNGTMKMGYAHISVGEYGNNKTEEITLHLDARYFDRVTLRVDCIGLDTGHILKEIDLYHLLNITRPKVPIKEDSLSDDTPKKKNGISLTEEETNG